MKKDKIWIASAIIIITVLSVITKSELIQIIAAIFGVVYVFGTAKENRYSQLCGVVNTGIYAYLMYKDKLYGTAVYDLFYCIPLQIYTFYTWGKDKSGKNKKEITRFTNNKRTLICIIRARRRQLLLLI